MNADAAREVWEAARDEHRAIAKILQTVRKLHDLGH
jgi:hypothetical protein